MQRLDSSSPDFQKRFDDILRQRSGGTLDVAQPVAKILADVRELGDEALCSYTERFDQLSLTPETLRISEEEIMQACESVPAALLDALDLAAVRIERFHALQAPAPIDHTDAAGVRMGMRWTPLDAVGLYVPGGKASYPSSVLMNAIPARIAGVKRLAMCVPTPKGAVNPLVLAAGKRAGVTEIYRIGGAQAIGALAYGTPTINAVDRIVGPGNAYVAEAKRQIFGHTGIDSIAGPSEVVVIADSSSDARIVALDLLAQAEHDEMAQAILITTDPDFASAVEFAVLRELATLPRTEIATASWREHGAVIIVKHWSEAAELVNRLAPEHLEILLDDPRPVFAAVRHAGAIFIGHFCPEAIGDYVGGPNHVLPTNRTARFASGLSVFDFLKRTTFIESTPGGLKEIGPAAVSLAHCEGLDAHALSVQARLDKLM